MPGNMPPFAIGGRRVWVAGHRGMVGSAIVRRLASESCEILTVDRATLDLRDQAATFAWIAEHRPDAIFVAAAKVGGILANANEPAAFLYENLVIQTNIVEGARRAGVAKLLLLGSSAVYPRLAEQPIAEEALLTGPLEPTHEGYAVAKIAGIKLAQTYRAQYGCDFITALPTNLYGPGDNFDPHSSHVVPGLIRKVDAAKRAGAGAVEIWGSGEPRREFLHADDCADACVFLMRHYSDAMPINVGSGEDLRILDLVGIVCEVIGFTGAIVTDRSKPDGPPRKLMRADRLRALGWAPRTALRDGIAATYRWFMEHQLREVA